MTHRRAMVAGNWKLNGTRNSIVALAREVADGISGLQSEVLICPSFVHLASLSAQLSGSELHLGAQNCSEQDAGAFTGEVSASMLFEYGCRYIIVGHSERRQLFAETSQQVANKVEIVQQASMIPILCVGETLEEREQGNMQAVIGAQLDAVITQCTVSAFAHLIVAYEPVWAIGTGKTASPEQAQDVHSMIRAKMHALDTDIADNLQILYGGSVKPDNAATLFSQIDIDGGLIGGASLDAQSFLGICRAAG